MRKKERFFRKNAAFLIGISLLLGVAGHEAAAGAKSDGGSGTGVRKIKYAFTNTLRPVSYLDENGRPAGYDIEVIKLIDERLPQYEIEFVGTTSEDAWLGVDTGKYQLCTTNSFRTKAREEKYLFASQNSSGGLEYLLLNKKFTDVKSLEDVSDRNLTMVPFRPADAAINVIKTYNDNHPGKQIKIDTIDQFENADGVKWVASNRYDSWVIYESIYKGLVTSDGAPLADLEKDLIVIPFTAIATWALINRDETEFLDAYETVLIQLKNEGKLSELSKNILGTDVFQFDFVPLN
ncbi:MAG: transporter substrate-binding domain-containing protein [Treponema sp.]|jgi:L-cystine transport system substrate-binding protein|nr:transporter substrate-binding domain-containing protein [Treponema sp.]